MKASELGRMIRNIVREEVELLLPKAVEKHLTEAYLKRLVSESAVRPQRARANSVMELMDREEEGDEIPSPKENTDQGIYNPESPLLQKKAQSEAVRNLLGKGNPLAFVYEGVKLPTDGMPVSPQLPDADFGEINRRVALMESSDHKPIDAGYDAKMRELEARRRALDVPVRQ
jgi:hypothetical protein